jgi:antitoxin (DNA-binding transcriptional repressor) of toxin-antitoxin stability system
VEANAKNHLPRSLKEVASGAEVIISEAGKPMAPLSRIEEGRQKNLFGVLKGKVNSAEDFDAPLPDGLLLEFEGS